MSPGSHVLAQVRETKQLKLREWFALRGPRYVGDRAVTLLSRYGITPSRAAARVADCVAMLAEHGCAPTFPTPGSVVQRHPRLIRRLQDAGAELAVHGYHHVDLGVSSPAEAARQLQRAAQTFSRHGIEVYGFRCPYLRCGDSLFSALPKGLFSYSSNKAIWWDAVPAADVGKATAVFHALQRFYQPVSALDTVSTPLTRSHVVEIPVSLPDDLQLHDGLHLGPQEMAQVWGRILDESHRRGELFVLQFHPELAWGDWHPFLMLLRQAKALQPRVWVVRLRDIASWWREKAGFTVDVSYSPEGLHISFSCSERATILVRGVDAGRGEPLWDGTYRRLEGRSLDVPAEPRPFVGLTAGAPGRLASFLREQGYILDCGETASRCATYLDLATLARLKSEVELTEHIEDSTAPLVRYWRWPDGAKSAMCITGDLDALSLVDYAFRLFVR